MPTDLTARALSTSPYDSCSSANWSRAAGSPFTTCRPVLCSPTSEPSTCLTARSDPSCSKSRIYQAERLHSLSRGFHFFLSGLFRSMNGSGTEVAHETRYHGYLRRDQPRRHVRPQRGNSAFHLSNKDTIRKARWIDQCSSTAAVDRLVSNSRLSVRLFLFLLLYGGGGIIETPRHVRLRHRLCPKI